MTKIRRQGVVIGNFIKYGGGTTLTHNKTMPPNSVSIAITTCLQAAIALPYPLLDHDLPIRIIKEALGFIVP